MRPPTPAPAASPDAPPTDPARLAPILWEFRLMGLFLLGPVIGLLLGAAVFGLPVPLRYAACVMFVFALALFASLIRTERRRRLRAATTLPRRTP